ncbi:DUF427 domain-containing protein, partial [Phenylobacterium aquaticum]
HPITITPAKTRWRARFENHVIADSGDALVLKEAAYKPVVYFPRADVSMEFMSKTERSTHCPYKGDASYYTVLMDGQFGENSVWSYEAPFPAMEQIRGHLAFYPDKIEVYEVDEAVVAPGAHRTDIADAILHTDAGDGASQRPHWPPNVSEPPAPAGE